MDDILSTIKKLLGIDPSLTHFDSEITVHINSALFSLTQLGLGPPGGFNIRGNQTTWAELFGIRDDSNAVQTYVYLKVRQVFDPPGTSFHLDAVSKQITELEWRLNVQLETP